MNGLYPKLAEADVWVFATPVYADGISGPMKNLFDRLIPLIKGRIAIRDGHCRHPRRDGSRGGKVVLVSNCGFYEMDNFDPLIVHLKAACRNFDREFTGALLRPYGWALKYKLKEGKGVDIVDAAKLAGTELVRDGRMKKGTMSAVSRHFMSLEEYLKWVDS
jgi:multimeric flavodoxin WrbA